MTLAKLRRCKAMLEQDPVLGPGVVVEGVGVRDTDSSLTVSVSGDPMTAERLLRARLGPDIAFRLLGAPIEQ